MSLFSRLAMGIAVGPPTAARGVGARLPRFQSMEFGVGLPRPTSERVGNSGGGRRMLSIGFDAHGTSLTPYQTTSWALPWEQGGSSEGVVRKAWARGRTIWSSRVGM
jgi:hypothetical protein